MKMKALLTVGIAALLATACNLPVARVTVEPATPTLESTAEASHPPAETATVAATETAATTVAAPDTQTPTEQAAQQVSFETGATSATVEGTVVADQEDEYLIYALEGQEMTVEVTTDGPNILVEIRSPGDEVLLSVREREVTWIRTLPASGNYLVRVVSEVDAAASYIMTFHIPPLESETVQSCPFTIEETVTAYRWPSTASDVFGTADAGAELVAQYATGDGWAGFDPGVAQAPNFGADRMRWIQTREGHVSFDPGCPGLPVVLSLDQLRNTSYRALDFDAFTLEDGEYRETSNGMVVQDTFIRDDVMSYADLDGDGDQDALVILATNSGGSGTFIELVAVRNDYDDPAYLTKVMLGDRVAIHHMTVIDGVITIEATIHAEDDPLCCPTQAATLRYRFEDGEFMAIES